MTSVNDRINTIQALALQAATEKADRVRPVFQGGVSFNTLSGGDNVCTSNLQSQFNQDVVINRNLTVSGTAF